MALDGHLKIDDIQGESRRVGHDDEIAVHGVHWKIAQIPQKAAPARSGRRPRQVAEVDSLTCTKTTDASSPYLALACMQGKSFKEMVLTLSVDAGDGATMDQVIITMQDVRVSGFEMVNVGEATDDDRMTEHVALSFGNVVYRYSEQNDDQSVGNEHEIQFDIAARG